MKKDNQKVTNLFQDADAKRKFMEYYETLMPINQDKFGEMIRNRYWAKATRDDGGSEFKITKDDVVQVYDKLIKEEI